LRRTPLAVHTGSGIDVESGVSVVKSQIVSDSLRQCGASHVDETNKVHPALKHAGYSATTLLPGEDSAAFEKLHRDLIAEFTPVGALEEDIVADMARLTWRKQNLATFQIAELAARRREQINREKVPESIYFSDGIDPAARREGIELQRSKPGRNSGTFIN
jgi:hypothetical protein